jgi:hypothetical protein
MYNNNIEAQDIYCNTRYPAQMNLTGTKVINFGSD